MIDCCWNVDACKAGLTNSSAPEITPVSYPNRKPPSAATAAGTNRNGLASPRDF